MSGGQSRGRVKGAMLMLSLLGVLAPQSKASKLDDAGYEVLQGLLKVMAAGLELVESIAVGVELEEAGQRRQRLFKVTSKIVEDGLLMLERGKNDKVELAKGQPNCTTVTTKSGELNAREGMISGLHCAVPSQHSAGEE
jgi:hypothetical protein